MHNLPPAATGVGSQMGYYSAVAVPKKYGEAP